MISRHFSWCIIETEGSFLGPQVNDPILGTTVVRVQALELPSLEDYCCHGAASDIAADNFISLLNRSGAYLKQLSLGVCWSCVEDIKILDPSPYLENLYLKFPCTERVDTFIIHELFERVSSSPPLRREMSPSFFLTLNH